jgi:N-acetylglucosamine-6-phosphate deacetylase
MTSSCVADQPRPTLIAVATIRGGLISQGDELVPGEVHFDSGIIAEGPTDDVVIDADGLIISAGLIDIQINGGFGMDFTHDPTTIWHVGERLPELGVTAFLPTIVTSPPEVTDLALDVVANRRPEDYHGAEVLGLHFEGPWISAEMHGAHNPSNITDPDAETATRWAKSGLVRIVTLAPERPGADLVAEILDSSDVVVSLGHTNADFDEARDALAGKASLVTHLFNQMTGFGHRQPGVVGAALLSDRPCILIVDEHHLAKGTLELAWRLLGPERLVLVTDAMAALGLGPGTYPLGDGPITVGTDGPRTVDGRLAGSVVTLPQAVRNLIDATGATTAQALRCATTTPTSVLGRADRGSLGSGRRADFTLLDESFGVIATYVAGARVHG